MVALMKPPVEWLTDSELLDELLMLTVFLRDQSSESDPIGIHWPVMRLRFPKTCSRITELAHEWTARHHNQE